jgi:hypothetical protein
LVQTEIELGLKVRSSRVRSYQPSQSLTAPSGKESAEQGKAREETCW